MIPTVYPWKDNGELMRHVFGDLLVSSGLWNPGDAVLDVTYQDGLWWTGFQPDNFTYRTRRTEPDFDFRILDYATDQFSLIAYDPTYCVSLDTQILTDRGWLSHDEVKVGDLAYGLDHDTGNAVWTPVLDVILLPAQKRMLLSMEGRSHSSLSSANHRWPTIKRCKTGEDGRGWATSESLMADDTVPVCASGASPTHPTHSDDLVALVAWFFTEGHVEGRCAGQPGVGTYGNICQSHVVNPEHCDAIERCLTAVFGPACESFTRLGRITDGVPRWRRSVAGSNHVYYLSSDAGAVLLEQAPDLVPSREFLRSLTADQLNIFLDVCADGDGCRSYSGTVFVQRAEAMAEAFAFACILAGRPITYRGRSMADAMFSVAERRRRVFKPSNNSPRWIRSDQPLWCVTTGTATWMARRNGSVYFTGNCAKGGRETSGVKDMDDRYGLGDIPARPADLLGMNIAGLVECFRVAERCVLLKSMDFVTGGDLLRHTTHLERVAEMMGWAVYDRLVHSPVGGRPQPSERRELHSRGRPSTLTVFTPHRHRKGIRARMLDATGGLILR